MTLVITDLTENGVAMASDSALNFLSSTGAGMRQIRKLQVIPYLNAGISMWGEGTVDLGDRILDTADWVAQFIEAHRWLEGVPEGLQYFVDEFVDALKPVLPAADPAKENWVGFHIAGYRLVDGSPLPTVYHVRNADGAFEQFRPFELRTDPEAVQYPIVGPGSRFRIANGDAKHFVVACAAAEQMLRTCGVAINADLESVVKYQMLWIRVVGEQYKEIDGYTPVDGLTRGITIAPDGAVREWDGSVLKRASDTRQAPDT